MAEDSALEAFRTPAENTPLSIKQKRDKVRQHGDAEDFKNYIYIYMILCSRYNCVAFDSDFDSGLVVDFDAMSSSPTERHYITIYELQSVSTSAVSTHHRNFAKMILDTQYKYAMRTIQIAGCNFLLTTRISDCKLATDKFLETNMSRRKIPV